MNLQQKLMRVLKPLELQKKNKRELTKLITSVGSEIDGD